ncbi:MAG: helix-turn-helix domain-containing protein [Acholeplasmataceae bacterium]
MSESMEITLEKLNSLLSTTEVAEMFDVSPGVVRRAARKGEVPGKIEVLGRVAFDPELVKDWEPPERRSAGRATRDDGRLRWKIWLTKEEAESLSEEGYEIENPREAARKRRAARKAKAAGTGVEESQVEDTDDDDDDDDDDDPFADFNV